MLENGTVKNSRYRVSNIIGKGGTSHVYLVRDMHLEKNWAMKEIENNNGISYMLAKREIEILKSIDFPMFPKIVDAWQEKNAVYIVSDYIEGISLEQVMETGPISRNCVYRWACGIASALKYLHGLSPPMLYLDLKPDNVLLKTNGEIALIDFGIAGQLASNTVPIGTPGYAAPEQYISGGRISERTDVYAFGMTYYALRTGRPPNTEATRALYEVRHNKILSNKEKHFIYKCISLKPEDRFKSSFDMAADLYHINYIFPKRKIITTAVAAISCGIIAAAVNQRFKIDASNQKAAAEMVEHANKYIVDGTYTDDGIRVVSAFINSGCLDRDTEQIFSYEVALNYFEKQHDYKKAQRYFEKLDLKIYPEAEYYVELCRLQSRFDYNVNDVSRCVNRLYTSVLRSSPNVRKYENLLCVANYYENYDEEQIEGIKKAITVLENGLVEMKNSGENTSSEIENLILKYEKKLEGLYFRAQIIES